MINLPHIIHASWRIELLPNGMRPCLKSFNMVAQSESLVFYDDLNCEEFIESEYPEFLQTYLSYPEGILRADIWRVLVLYKYGGVYADIDVECVKPICELMTRVGHDRWEILLPMDHPAHADIHYGGKHMWMNDFMVAKPGSRFLKRVIEEFEKQGGGNRGRAVTEVRALLGERDGKESYGNRGCGAYGVRAAGRGSIGGAGGNAELESIYGSADILLGLVSYHKCSALGCRMRGADYPLGKE
jgi:hypothetical protein